MEGRAEKQIFPGRTAIRRRAAEALRITGVRLARRSSFRFRDQLVPLSRKIQKLVGGLSQSEEAALEVRI
jgi:hypothetical protein